MDKKKSGLNILIIVEVIILIAVLAVGLLHSFSKIPGKIAEKRQEAMEDQTSAESEITETAADAVAAVASDGTDQATGNDNEIVTDTWSADVQAKLDEMTTEQKVAQLFMVKVDAFTEVDATTVVGDTLRGNYTDYPVGGLVFDSGNTIGHDQIVDMTTDTESVANDVIGLPVYTAVYEQGGSGSDSSPIGSHTDNGALDTPKTISESGDAQTAQDWGSQMSAYLSEMGFDLNLGVNADISNEDNESDYTFGTDADTVKTTLTSVLGGYSGSDVAVSLRAFPDRHDVTASDSGLPVLEKTSDELKLDEYITFQSGIDAGAQMVQLADVLNSALTGDDTTPCSVSTGTVNALRNDLHFDGIILSGDVNDSAVAEACDGNAAVAALQAGADMIYCTDSFKDTYQAVLDAVNDGTVSEDSLNQAVGRILTQKME